MLPNHIPFIVAEQFGTLSALAPNRIDLGIGRGPGVVDEAFMQELRHHFPSPSDESYANEVTKLVSYFRAEGHGDIRVPTAESDVPELWILASSAAGAQMAAHLGLPLSFGYHFKPDNAQAAIEDYRTQFRPSPWLSHPHVMISTVAICADTEDRAEQLALPADVFWANLLAGRKKPVPSPEEAAAYRFSEAEEEARWKRRSFEAVGSAATVAQKIRDLVARFDPDELTIFTHVSDIEAKMRSFELISEHLTGATPRRHGHL
jgi:luciferase family oxidoreductase group 1